MGSMPHPTARPSHRRLFKALFSVLPLLALLGAVSATSSAMAQSVHQYSFPSTSGSGGYIAPHGTSTGGAVRSGTAVPTASCSATSEPFVSWVTFVPSAEAWNTWRSPFRSLSKTIPPSGAQVACAIVHKRIDCCEERSDEAIQNPTAR